MTASPTARAKSHTSKIWIAGDWRQALKVVREYCDEKGDCYAVTATEFVFTDGTEPGVCVSRIQYPRFPIPESEIATRMEELALRLCEELRQQSFSIEGPNTTDWYSNNA